ncbi:sigma-70 region 4 domain-containing protein [Acidobacteria bacterium AH-259-O06]|nr:sigma-70 region 4 domain-containing protein [Acidobacteria bacterium AH-259-O06]
MLRLNSLEREKLFDRIIEALNEMPNLPRQAFILSHYQGLSSEEIAIRIGVKQQDIRFLLRRANTFLYERLSPLVPREEGRKSRRAEVADQVSTGQDIPTPVEYRCS